jgi:ribosomal protein S18 acetylase RimI-like enzyme
MPSMTDPTDGMVSFQQALIDGTIDLRPGELDPDIFVHADEPTPGVLRITYVRLDGQTVKAFASVVGVERLDGLPCFQLGVAVPVAYRNRGYAKSVLRSAIAELQHGLARNRIPSFYIEGIVGADNEPSKRASAATISSNPTAITDSVSGLPALHYIRKV